MLVWLSITFEVKGFYRDEILLSKSDFVDFGVSKYLDLTFNCIFKPKLRSLKGFRLRTFTVSVLRSARDYSNLMKFCSLVKSYGTKLLLLILIEGNFIGCFGLKWGKLKRWFVEVTEYWLLSFAGGKICTLY